MRVEESVKLFLDLFKTWQNAFMAIFFLFLTIFIWSLFAFLQQSRKKRHSKDSQDNPISRHYKPQNFQPIHNQSLLLRFFDVFLYYVKTMIYVSVIFNVSLVWPFFLLMGHGKRNPRNQKYVYDLYYRVCKIFGIKFEVRDYENLEKYDSYVIVSNHQSSLDLLSQSTVWPQNCTTIAKREVIYLGPFGALSYVTGVVYIDRKNFESAKRTLDTLGNRLKPEKLKVWIFPEGTRNHGTGILPFKKGAFHLAVQAQVPICPVVFSSYYPFYCRYEKRFKRGKVIVTCLPPIPTAGLSYDDVEQLSHKVRHLMVRAFMDSSANAYPSYFGLGTPLRTRWDKLESEYEERLIEKLHDRIDEFMESFDDSNVTQNMPSATGRMNDDIKNNNTKNQGDTPNSIQSVRSDIKAPHQYNEESSDVFTFDTHDMIRDFINYNSDTASDYKNSTSLYDGNSKNVGNIIVTKDVKSSQNNISDIGAPQNTCQAGNSVCSKNTSPKRLSPTTPKTKPFISSTGDPVIDKLFDQERYQEGITDPVTQFLDKIVQKIQNHSPSSSPNKRPMKNT